MMEGRVKAALRLISQDNYRGTLALDSIVDSDNNQTVCDILFQKHPSRQPITKSAIISSHATPSQQHPHPILFDKIDGHLIHSTILRMDGAAGPVLTVVHGNVYALLSSLPPPTSVKL